MSDCLVYWKYYWDDVLKYGPQLVTEHWHTHYKGFFDKVEPGNNLWVVTTSGPNYPEEWRLLESLRIHRLDIDPDPQYGKYHAFGDISKSFFYSLDDQKDFTPILHSLNFRSGKKIPRVIRGRNIGNFLQSIRTLSRGDIVTLRDYTKTIPIVKNYTLDRERRDIIMR